MDPSSRVLSRSKRVAVASAIVGLAALVPYVIGVRQVDPGDAGVQMNIAIHAVGHRGRRHHRHGFRGARLDRPEDLSNSE